MKTIDNNKPKEKDLSLLLLFLLALILMASSCKTSNNDEESIIRFSKEQVVTNHIFIAGYY